MPFYPCLVLDHDDTVVRSEEMINYPYFCQVLSEYCPGRTVTLEEYTRGCYELGFGVMFRQVYGFTDEQVQEEFQGWLEYVKTHIAPPFPGVGEIIRRQRALGGLVCVVSHSGRDVITRDYETHFGIQPDGIYSWELPEHLRKPNPYALQDIMETFHLKPSELLVVDDMRPGQQMAAAAGVETAFAGWGRRKFPAICQEMEQLCDYSFYDPTELTHFLFD